MLWHPPYELEENAPSEHGSMESRDWTELCAFYVHFMRALQYTNGGVTILQQLIRFDNNSLFLF